MRRRRGARCAARPEGLDDDHAAAATGAWQAVVGSSADGHVGIVLFGDGSIDDGGVAISSLARAILALQVALASNP